MQSAAIVESVAVLLGKMCLVNDVTREHGISGVSMFHAICEAPISVLDYLARIRKYSACSDSCFIAAVIYLDHAQKRAGLTVDSLSVHRLILTSIMLASKFYDDRIQHNRVYAHIGGLTVAELNRLESELFRCLDFNMNLDADEYYAYERALMGMHQSTSAANKQQQVERPKPTCLSPPPSTSYSQTSSSMSTSSPSSSSSLSVPRSTPKSSIHIPMAAALRRSSISSSPNASTYSSQISCATSLSPTPSAHTTVSAFASDSDISMTPAEYRWPTSASTYQRCVYAGGASHS